MTTSLIELWVERMISGGDSWISSSLLPYLTIKVVKNGSFCPADWKKSDEVVKAQVSGEV